MQESEPFCVVPGCEHESLEDEFIQFPEDKATRILWALSLQRQQFIPVEWWPEREDFICKRHFLSQRKYRSKKFYAKGKVRKSFCNKDKLKVVNFVKIHGSKAAERKFGVSHDNIRLWLKQENVLHKAPKYTTRARRVDAYLFKNGKKKPSHSSIENKENAEGRENKKEQTQLRGNKVVEKNNNKAVLVTRSEEKFATKFTNHNVFAMEMENNSVQSVKSKELTAESTNQVDTMETNGDLNESVQIKIVAMETENIDDQSVKKEEIPETRNASSMTTDFDSSQNKTVTMETKTAKPCYIDIEIICDKNSTKGHETVSMETENAESRFIGIEILQDKSKTDSTTATCNKSFVSMETKNAESYYFDIEILHKKNQTNTDSDRSLVSTEAKNAESCSDDNGNSCDEDKTNSTTEKSLVAMETEIAASPNIDIENSCDKSKAKSTRGESLVTMETKNAESCNTDKENLHDRNKMKATSDNGSVSIETNNAESCNPDDKNKTNSTSEKLVPMGMKYAESSNTDEKNKTNSTREKSLVSMGTKNAESCNTDEENSCDKNKINSTGGKEESEKVGSDKKKSLYPQTSCIVEILYGRNTKNRTENCLVLPINYFDVVVKNCLWEYQQRGRCNGKRNYKQSVLWRLWYKDAIFEKLTGFKTSEHFELFFSILGPSAMTLGSGELSPMDELFLTVIRHRNLRTRAELAGIFGITKTAVDKIFKLWTKFLNSQLNIVFMCQDKDSWCTGI